MVLFVEEVEEGAEEGDGGDDNDDVEFDRDPDYVLAEVV